MGSHIGKKRKKERPMKRPKIAWEELPVLDIIAVILAFVSLVVTILLTQHVRKHVPGELTDEGKGDDGEDGEDPKCVVHHYHIIHPRPPV